MLTWTPSCRTQRRSISCPLVLGRSMALDTASRRNSISTDPLISRTSFQTLQSKRKYNRSLKFGRTIGLTRQSIHSELNVTEQDLGEAKAIADQMSLEEVRTLMENVLLQHDHDPNFPFIVLEKIKDFLGQSPYLYSPGQASLTVKHSKRFYHRQSGKA